MQAPLGFDDLFGGLQVGEAPLPALVAQPAPAPRAQALTDILMDMPSFPAAPDSQPLSMPRPAQSNFMASSADVWGLPLQHPAPMQQQQQQQHSPGVFRSVQPMPVYGGIGGAATPGMSSVGGAMPLHTLLGGGAPARQASLPLGSKSSRKDDAFAFVEQHVNLAKQLNE